MKCQLCGNGITDLQNARVVLPWGETCSVCVDEINQKATK
jgi:hypothetical protein